MRHFGLILLACAGCSVGVGTGSATGNLWMQQCTDDTALGSQAAPAAFDLHPRYYVALPINDSRNLLQAMNHLQIRIQSAGNAVEEADLIYITVEDVEQVARALGQNIEVGPATNIRATLGLFRSCPKAPVQLELDGVINFTQFGVIDPATPVQPGFRLQIGDPLQANFSFAVTDRRAITLGGVGSVTSTPVAGGNLGGNFAFSVTQGRAAQPY
jgi:hypothetical protein